MTDAERVLSELSWRAKLRLKDEPEPQFDRAARRLAERVMREDDPGLVDREFIESIAKLQSGEYVMFVPGFTLIFGRDHRGQWQLELRQDDQGIALGPQKTRGQVLRLLAALGRGE